jgi:integrase
VKLRNAIRFGDAVSAASPTVSTVNELCDAFLARHRVDEATLRKLRTQLKHARVAFGERPPQTLQTIELDVWRSTLPARSAHYIFRAFRQVLEYAVAMGLLERNPTARIKNTRASVDEHREQRPFESWEQVEVITAEMDPRFAAIPLALVGTGLRPEELFALERRDLDLTAGVLNVERVFSQGPLKECKKSSRRRRRVPLRQRVVETLRALPPRLETRRCCSRPRGAALSTSRSSGTANGCPRSGQRALTIVVSMTAGTPSPPGRSPEASSSSTLLASWEPRSRRSTRPTGTCSPTRTNTCEASLTTTTVAQQPLPASAGRARLRLRADALAPPGRVATVLGRRLRFSEALARMGRGAMNMYQEPAAVAPLADHAHAIRVSLTTLVGRCGLRALRQEPSHRSRGRDITAIPCPGVSGSPLRVAVKKRSHLVGAAKKRFLGRDHHDVGIRREQLHDAVGIPRREPGTEALQ